MKKEFFRFLEKRDIIQEGDEYAGPLKYPTEFRLYCWEPAHEVHIGKFAGAYKCLWKRKVELLEILL